MIEKWMRPTLLPSRMLVTSWRACRKPWRTPLATLGCSQENSPREPKGCITHTHSVCILCAGQEVLNCYIWCTIHNGCILVSAFIMSLSSCCWLLSRNGSFVSWSWLWIENVKLPGFGSILYLFPPSKNHLVFKNRFPMSELSEETQFLLSSL